MENSSHYHEKIIFFCDLSRGEQEELLRHVGQCADCQKKWSEFQALSVSLSHQHEVGDKLLERYSIYLEAPNEMDYDGSHISKQEMTMLSKHLAECPACRKKVELLRQEYRDMIGFLENTEMGKVTSGNLDLKTSTWGNLADSFEKISVRVKQVLSPASPIFYPVSVGIMAAILLLLWFGPFFRSSDGPYRDLAVMEHPDFSLTTRSSNAESLQSGFKAFENRKYEQVIRELESHLSSYPSSSDRFDMAFALGFFYTAVAESDFLEGFPKSMKIF